MQAQSSRGGWLGSWACVKAVGLHLDPQSFCSLVHVLACRAFSTLKYPPRLNFLSHDLLVTPHCEVCLPSGAYLP